MKAFILAAGLGSRLKPLTNNIPKPMLPILGKPVLYYTLLNLKKNGFNNVCINLYYNHKIITKFLKNNNDIDIKLEFSYEEKLLGTAGAVKNKEDFFDETFVVISGDGLTDINLKKALEFHKKKKSIATIVLKKVDLKFKYGIAVTNKKDEIKSFIEKPSWSEIFDDKINTGIYIFEPDIFKFIPKNKFFDFSMDLFPILLKKKEKIYGYLMDEYWTDIGSVFEYKKSVFDVLDGKISIINVKKKCSKYISDSAKIDKNVKINGPYFIGDNVVIKGNVIIEPYSVILNNVEISNNVSIEKSIIWENSKIGANTNILNTVIGYNTILRGNISLCDSIVI